MKLQNRVLKSLEGPWRHTLYNKVAKHDIGIILIYLLVFLTSPVTTSSGHDGSEHTYMRGHFLKQQPHAEHVGKVAQDGDIATDRKPDG